MIPNRQIRAIAHFLTLTLATTLVNGKDDFSPDEIRDIDAFAGDVMGCANIPGLALGVVRGGATFATGHGVADMMTAHPVDKRTIFNLGSTAKAFVPYVLAEIMNGKENHNGRIKWNSTLKEILTHDSDLEVPSPWAEMTLKDMLIFKSGSSAADMATMVGLPNDVTREELIRRTRFLPESEAFRKSNHYSNMMYTIAGNLAERMSRMSWADLVKTRVLDKQYMNTSSFAPKGMTLEDAALPYRYHLTGLSEPFVEQNMTLFDIHPFEPVGSLMASAEDVTKWLRHLLHNLHVKVNDSGVNMLIEDAFHQWVTVPADHQEGTTVHDSEEPLGYGMGWYASTYRGQRRYKFAGGLYAYSSQIWLFPDAQSAIFVAMNGPGTEHSQRALDAVMFHTSDITLRRSSWVDKDVACCCTDTDYDYPDYYEEEEEIAPAEHKMVNYLAPVDSYIGKYGNGLVGNLVIEANQAGVLVLKLGKNLKGELTPDVTDSKMKFLATGWLLNTEEWCTEKTVEFLPSLTQSRETGDKIFERVRIYLKDDLFYEFVRGKLFETMLIDAEEEDRRKEEEEELKNSASHMNKVETTTIESVEFEFEDSTETSDIRNSGNGPSDTDSNEWEGNVHHGDGFKSDTHENNADRHENNVESPFEKSLNPDSHQSHQPYNVEGQEETPDLETEEDLKKAAEAGRKVRDKDVATSRPENASSSVHTLSLIVFLIVLLNIVISKN